jgi:hypothetical protein
MAKDNEGFLAKILATPEGRQVVIALVNTWQNTGDVKQSLDTARHVAESNGTLKLFELATFIDGLNFLLRIAPLLAKPD